MQWHGIPPCRFERLSLPRKDLRCKKLKSIFLVKFQSKDKSSESPEDMANRSFTRDGVQPILYLKRDTSTGLEHFLLVSHGPNFKI